MSQSNGEDILRELARVLDGRKGGDPDLSYVSRLFHKGQDAILKKVGEEATELVMASKDGVADKVIAE
ncbi:MAG: phosphoribosyl-ATP diphosphatase, partial [Burkholderiales bacterium]|nr:phosphoribosyl-ATP diphosphatase [Burkholderiales bacterium]